VLDWTPDGKALLFTSDRTGSLGLWSIAVVDGKPNGQPALLKTDIGKITSLGLSSKRTLYYSMATGVRGMERGIADIYTVSIDPNTLKPGSEPAPAAQRFLGTNSGADWSPDGKYLAYASKRGSVWQSPSALRFIRIALGRKLFFDKHLSSDETLSCASCHDPKLSFSDGGKVARGINGQEGTRNAPAIINRGYGRTFFWDGRVKSLEQQVLEPILNPKELGMTESLVESRTHLRIAGVTAYFMTRAVSRFRVRRRIVGRSRSQLCGRSRALLRTCTTEAFRRWKTWSITMIGAGTRIRI